MQAVIDRKPKRMAARAVMRAAVLVEPRRFEVREVARVQPGPTELLVRLQGCGICASNLPPFEGRRWFTYPMQPGALGHEGWGIVERVGQSVHDFAAGDRVGVLSQHAFAEFDVADSDALVRLPASLEDEPFPAEPLGCALNIFKRSRIQSNDVVAIIGIGFLGALLTQLCVAADARVIAISRRRFALNLARDFGASEVLDGSVRAIERVKEITGGKFCDIVIEAAGKQSTLDLAAELTRERGRLIIAGYHQDGPRQVNMQLWNWRGLDVFNAHERDPKAYHAGMKAAVSAVEDGRVDPQPLYTHHFPLGNIADAFEMAINRPAGFMKALICMP
jgi:NADPH:quinone reductase